MAKKFKIAQITDCHLFDDPTTLLNGFNTTQNLIAMLLNADTFLDMTKQFQKMRAVLFGQIHQEMEALHGNTLFLSAPATAYQIKPFSKEMTVDPLTPGYRWIEFDDDGNIETGIRRLPMSKKNGTS